MVNFCFLKSGLGILFAFDHIERYSKNSEPINPFFCFSFKLKQNCIKITIKNSRNGIYNTIHKSEGINPNNKSETRIQNHSNHLLPPSCEKKKKKNHLVEAVYYVFLSRFSHFHPLCLFFLIFYVV